MDASHALLPRLAGISLTLIGLALAVAGLYFRWPQEPCGGGTPPPFGGCGGGPSMAAGAVLLVGGLVAWAWGGGGREREGMRSDARARLP